MFCSAKGGVGKSTLAMASAVVAAENGRTLVIDADLTGTSLADGLAIEAPDLPMGSDGLLEVTGPPTGRFLPRDEAFRDRRHARGRCDPRQAHYLPFFNDALVFQGPEDVDPGLDTLAWRLPGVDELEILPSSPVRPDVLVGVNMLERPERDRRSLVDRVAALVRMRASAEPPLGCVIVDLPPGLFGFAYDFIQVALALENEPGEPHFAAHLVLVTSEDRNDLGAAIDGFLALRPRVPRLRCLLNRRRQPATVTTDWIREQYPGLGVEGEIEYVDDFPETLGRTFVEGRMVLEPGARAQIQAILDSRGGRWAARS